MHTQQTKQTVGVVGAGAMGRGIVQLFAQAGHDVRCHDAQPGAAAHGVEYARSQVARLAEKGRLTPAEADAAAARMQAVASLGELAGCDAVIEAVVENLEVKRALFTELEAIVDAEAILASNTSSLVVADIAAACRHPGRVAGLHFFNPVPLMKVAEVIAAVRTAPRVVDALRDLVAGTGHRAVVAADQPGFLVNHAGRGFYTEGLRLLEERVAEPVDVDDVLREALGFRMGPFELLDLTGLDVSGRVMASIYEQFLQEPRFRPSPLVPPRMAAGLFGRKTGEGWYVYEGDRAVRPAARPVPALPAGLRVWVDPAADGHDALLALARAAGATVVDRVDDTGDAEVLQLIQPWGQDATRSARAAGLDASRTVAVDPLPAFDRRRTLMLTVATAPRWRDAAHALLASDGVPVTVIHDSPGFIAQRVLATIVNIACGIAQAGIASVDDLDDAVRLGLGYPQGPLAWGDAVGAGRIARILRGVHAATDDPRYRTSPWLARRAALGLSLRTAEALR